MRSSDLFVEALVLASESDSAEVFTLGGARAISLTDLASLLVEINRGGEVIHRSFPPDRKRIDIGDYYADFGRAKSLLGWEPRISLRDGLSRTLEYYRTNLGEYL